jgi:hypothetical protein
VKHRRFDAMPPRIGSRWKVGPPFHRERVEHSPALLVLVEDPDQNRLRLYTLETHGPDLKLDEDDAWIEYNA